MTCDLIEIFFSKRKGPAAAWKNEYCYSDNGWMDVSTRERWRQSE
jgi:hypothetical protein